MKRKNIAAGNWKMNTTLSSARLLIDGLVKGDKADNALMIIAPPFPYLTAAIEQTRNSGIMIAAQNCHPAPKGAFTGEVSIDMLADIGVDAIIIGHSERREIFHESNDFIKEKLDAILVNGLTPIFCCGEPLQVRKAGQEKSFVEKQLKESLLHVAESDISQVIVAYEPIWAIGTGETASPDQAEEMHAHIRGLLTEKYGAEIAASVSVLYGGSVKPGNSREIFANENVDGGLVGGASLNANDFLAIHNSF